MKTNLLRMTAMMLLVLTAACNSTPTTLETTQTQALDDMMMVFVPAGTFTMGSDQDDFTSPAHPVTLDEFWIDQTEVTNALFADFLNTMGNQSEEGIDWWEPGIGHNNIIYGHIEENEGVYSPEPGYEHHPVIEVSWYGATAYCDWVGGRLPTEAEWEYTARGPESLIYPWGNEFDGKLVNYCDSSCTQKWRDSSFNDGQEEWGPVGSYPDGASWCGAYDMAGNVWEWTNDHWSEEYFSNSPSENPQGPDSGEHYVVKGASWYDEADRMVTFTRKGLTASSYRMHWVGFRCVKD